MLATSLDSVERPLLTDLVPYLTFVGRSLASLAYVRSLQTIPFALPFLSFPFLSFPLHRQLLTPCLRWTSNMWRRQQVMDPAACYTASSIGKLSRKAQFQQ